MKTEYFDYHDGAEACEAFIAAPDGGGPRPCVLVAHQWAGQIDHERDTARAMAEAGYVGMAIDVYGKGVRGDPHGDNSALMNPWGGDRGKLKTRLLAAVEAAKARPEVDASRIAVMGYCFGGLCALDLARAATPDIKGAVSIHGVFGAPNLGPQAPITAKVLVLHGWEDPLATPNDMLALCKELTEAGADWQYTAYGHVVHAFTNKAANSRENGAAYDAKADRRSRQATLNFLAELFG